LIYKLIKSPQFGDAPSYACVFRSWKAAVPADAGPGFRMMPGRV
jgi:hypothetical protein